MKLLQFLKYKALDTKTNYDLRKSGVKTFSEYGLRLYSGCQGSGKTSSMIEQLERYRLEYGGQLFIATNFGYKNQDLALETFEDLVDLPKLVRELGYIGLVIGWDEIQNDFDNTTRNFPVTILRTITQQRKQAIKILATSQVFTRVAKPIREQTFEVVQCRTFVGRWVFQKWYDPVEYEYYIANANKDQKLPVKRKYNYVQTDHMRDQYDSYAVIDNLGKQVELSLEERIRMGYGKNDPIIGQAAEPKRILIN
ncbi:ATPase [Enterococcus plantarum]|uniref:ATPase n=1 Tax=Enterococcus plantarum TaxID=1077675 RepID=UPI001A90239E|nr:ATPase [Enterococcus plantarum]MBO0468433.1 ATPase [Enterococcus plantarum]